MSNIHVVWLQGQACTGCTVSFTNATHPSFTDLLTGFIPPAAGVTLDFHQTIMTPWGEQATQILDAANEGKLAPLVLAVEGAVPDESIAGKTGGFWCLAGESEGKPVTFAERLSDLSKKAALVVAVGTCATYGGIPHGKPNPTGAKGVLDYLGRDWTSALGLPVVCVPGCPVHGEHLAEVLAHAVLAVREVIPLPELDNEHRPVHIFGHTAHENCPRAGLFADGKNSHTFGEPYCMGLLGCKGPVSHCDVPRRGFIEGVGGCPTVGSPCIGCTEPRFPDRPYSPFLGKPPKWPFVSEKIKGTWGSIDALWSRFKDWVFGRKI
ncbi:MAG: hydrogenase small subunit [Candidatus Heimdallarchaeota archaeon]